jgi:hypothetical protein
VVLALKLPSKQDDDPQSETASVLQSESESESDCRTARLPYCTPVFAEGVLEKSASESSSSELEPSDK